MTSSLGYMFVNEPFNGSELNKQQADKALTLHEKLTTKKAQDVISRIHATQENEEDTNYNMDEDEDLGNGNYADEFYNTNLTNPSFVSNELNSTGESDLIRKINYMIELLEETHDEKRNSITEETVLYCFLGVFIIFMIESFTKIGKYVR